MEEVTLKGLTFVPFIRREEIAKQIKRVAAEIKRDCPDENPMFLCVLNGAFIFAADLYRSIDFPESEITFVRYKSYDGMHSTNEVKQIIGLTEDIENRCVYIIEDIVDTGLTALQLRKTLEQYNPKFVKMITLLFKPDSLTVGEPPEFICFSIPSKFILGYGLDLDGMARNLPDIYVLKEQFEDEA